MLEDQIDIQAPSKPHPVAPAPIKKGVHFIEQYCSFREPPEKYNQSEKLEFQKQYSELNVEQKHRCCEILLINAWNYINGHYYTKAQKEICLAIPLCDQAGFSFKSYEIERLFWEAFGNHQKISEDQRQENRQLLVDCGFDISQYTLQKPKPVKPEKKKPQNRPTNFLSCFGNKK